MTAAQSTKSVGKSTPPQEGGKPGFPRRQTQLTSGAQAELDKVVGDFEGQLEALAREKSRGLDDVQTVNIRDARAELLVTRLDELANVGVVIMLPIGLFLLGLSGNAVIGAWTGTPAHWSFCVIAAAGGVISGLSLGVYFTRGTLKRLFARRAKSSN